jgi:hypothetical protein
MKWLQQNPVRNRGDIEFFTNKVMRLEEALTSPRNARECQAMQSVVVVQKVQAAMEDVDTVKDLCLPIASS